MAFTNLLAKIEGEINEAVKKMQQQPFANQEFDELVTKKRKLEKLAFDYLALEGRFKELTGLNSIY